MEHDFGSVDQDSGADGSVVEVHYGNDVDAAELVGDLAVVAVAVGKGGGQVELSREIQQAQRELGDALPAGVVHLHQRDFRQTVFGIVETDVLHFEPVAVCQLTVERGRAVGDFIAMVRQVRPDGLSDVHDDVVVHAVAHGRGDVLAHDVFDQVSGRERVKNCVKMFPPRVGCCGRGSGGVGRGGVGGRL